MLFLLKDFLGLGVSDYTVWSQYSIHPFEISLAYIVEDADLYYILC